MTDDYVSNVSSDGETIFWRLTDRRTGRVGEGYSREEAVAMIERPLGPTDCPQCGRPVEWLDIEAGVIVHTAMGTWMGLARNMPQPSLSTSMPTIDRWPDGDEYTAKPCGDVVPRIFTKALVDALRTAPSRQRRPLMVRSSRRNRGD